MQQYNKRPCLAASNTSTHLDSPFAMDRISSPEGHHTPMSPLQRPGYSFMRNRELPSESMYGRLNGHGLPIPAPTDSAQVPVPYQNFQQSTKGAPYEGPPGFRAHMGYPLLNRVNNAEHLSFSRSLPPVSDSQMVKNRPPVGYGQAFLQRVVLKAPQGKAHRATQVCQASRRRGCFGDFPTNTPAI